MAQHFLLSAAARTLKLKDVYRMSDDEAFKAFAAVRFAENGGEAFCPDCGCTEPYFIATRRKWKCRACGKQFSATSGTIFASCKMAFVDLLAAICIWAIEVRLHPAQQHERQHMLQPLVPSVHALPVKVAERAVYRLVL